ncbi:MAG TPA: lysophospholipase [Lentisphaeria bacterium]|nr:lysophospholipase [Lentisphaeria bacterium]
MRVYRNCQLHNVAETEPFEGGGVFLRRFPGRIRNVLNPLGQMVSQESAGVELRFITDAKSFTLSVGSLPAFFAQYENHHQDIFIFRGAFFHSHHRIEPGKINHISPISLQYVDRFAEIGTEYHAQSGFSNQVWRVMFGRYPAIFYGIETYGSLLRPPEKHETPAVKWLAYGSSITNGASPTVHHNAYIYNAARAAGIDVCNQGLSGSCRCEPEITDYFCSRNDWDIITLEIGVNMRGEFNPESFSERAGNLIHSLCKKHPQDKIAVITIFPNSMTTGFTSMPDSNAATSEMDFCRILRKIVKKSNYPNLFLIEGKDLLVDFGTLSTDLIHPGDYGHLTMGKLLGGKLKTILKGKLT